MSTARRANITICILTGHDRDRPRRLLDGLMSELADGDSVVVLGPGHHPDAVASWRQMQGRRLIRPSRPPELSSLLLALDDRVLLAPGSIDALASCLTDPSVAAASAWSNVTSGDDLFLGAPYRPQDRATLRAFFRSLRRVPDGAQSPVSSLGSPCMLLRSTDVLAHGGLGALEEPDAWNELMASLRSARGRLVVSDAAYAHHPGGPLRPARTSQVLLSACLIVRDEEQRLRACVESIRDFVDEIVVHDTGSQDGTVALARELGAIVDEGYWDDDFSRARNAALARCRGQWILWIDADETISAGDPAGLRRRLEATATTIDGCIVMIDNLRGTEAATVLPHPAVRLFRRATCRWEGRLHEQILLRDGSPPSVVPTDALRIAHRGYLQREVSTRNKAQRNLRSAFGDLTAVSDLDLPTRLVSLGRSYVLAGRPREGQELCERAIELGAAGTTLRLALRALAEGHLDLQDAPGTLAVGRRLRAVSQVPALAALFEGRAYSLQGEHAAALHALEEVGKVVDDDGFEYSPAMVADLRAEALLALDRPTEAADLLLATLRESGGLDAHLGMLLVALERSNSDLALAHRAIGPARLAAFVPQLLQLRPDLADRALEAWFPLEAENRLLLAAAARIARQLPVARQLQWSARLRAAGLTAACPLLSAHSPGERSPADGILAAAVARASFGDARARQALLAHALRLPDELRPAVESALDSLAPGLARELSALAPGPAVREASSPRPEGTTLIVSRQPGLAWLCAALAACAPDEAECIVLATRTPCTPVPPARMVTLSAEAWAESAPDAVASLALQHDVRKIVRAAHETSRAGLYAEMAPAAEITVGTTESPLIAEGVARLVSRCSRATASARHGVCVAVALGAETHTASDAPSAQSAPLIEAALTALCAPSVAIVGDDPQGTLSPLVTDAIDATGVDPVPWILASRELVIADAANAAMWISLARATDTAWRLLSVRADKTEATARSSDLPCSSVRESASSPVAPDIIVSGAHILGPPADGPDLTAALAAFANTVVPGLRDATECERALALPSPARGGLPASWVVRLRERKLTCWVPSAQVAERAVAAGLAPDQVVVVTPRADPRACATPPPEETAHLPRIGYLGPLSEAGGIDVLLETLVAFLPPLDLLVAVQPELDGLVVDPEFPRTALSLLHSERIHARVVTDALTPRARGALYRSCDVIVDPGRVPTFSSVTIAAEARACGVGLVTTQEDLAGPAIWTVSTFPRPASEVGWSIASPAGFEWHEPSRPALATALQAALRAASARRNNRSAAGARPMTDAVLTS